jgi:hypothetical protein
VYSVCASAAAFQAAPLPTLDDCCGLQHAHSNPKIEFPSASSLRSWAIWIWAAQLLVSKISNTKFGAFVEGVSIFAAIELMRNGTPEVFA